MVPESESLGIRSSIGVSPSLRAEDWYPSSKSQAERGSFSLPLPFCSIQALNRLDEDHPHGGSNLLYSVISCGNTLPYISRNDVHPVSGHPVTQRSDT